MANNTSVVSDEAMRYVIKRIIHKDEKEVIRVCQVTDDLFGYHQGSTASEFGIMKKISKKRRFE